MSTPEEVRKEADEYKRKLGTDTTGQMLLAYADLLEAIEELDKEAASYMVGPLAIIRTRATEKARNK